MKNLLLVAILGLVALGSGVGLIIAADCYGWIGSNPSNPDMETAVGPHGIDQDRCPFCTPSLIKSLTREKAIREGASKALGECGVAAVDPLIAALIGKENDTNTRALSAYALGLIGAAAKKALPTLTGIMNDRKEDKEVQRYAQPAEERIRKAL